MKSMLDPKRLKSCQFLFDNTSTFWHTGFAASCGNQRLEGLSIHLNSTCQPNQNRNQAGQPRPLAALKGHKFPQIIYDLPFIKY